MKPTSRASSWAAKVTTCRLNTCATCGKSSGDARGPQCFSGEPQDHHDQCRWSHRLEHASVSRATLETNLHGEHHRASVEAGHLVIFSRPNPLGLDKKGITIAADRGKREDLSITLSSDDGKNCQSKLGIAAPIFRVSQLLSMKPLRRMLLTPP